jgi:hypothetical protein
VKPGRVEDEDPTEPRELEPAERAAREEEFQALRERRVEDLYRRDRDRAAYVRRMSHVRGRVLGYDPHAAPAPARRPSAANSGPVVLVPIVDAAPAPSRRLSAANIGAVVVVVPPDFGVPPIVDPEQEDLDDPYGFFEDRDELLISPVSLYSLEECERKEVRTVEEACDSSRPTPYNVNRLRLAAACDALYGDLGAILEARALRTVGGTLNACVVFGFLVLGWWAAGSHVRFRQLVAAVDEASSCWSE